MRLVGLFFSLLLSGSATLIADDWLDYDPPLMDDATVDTIRYSPQGEFFDLSDPGFRTSVHQQTAQSKIVPSSDKKKIVVQFEFQGKKELEYVHLLTPIKIEQQGYRLGGRFKIHFNSTGSDEVGTIGVRFRDPSGEIHQQSFGKPTGEMQFVPVERTSRSWDTWGGDNDKILQFPCVIDSILLDRPRGDYKAKGTLEIRDLALYKAAEPDAMLKLQFAAENPRALVFDGRGMLRFRLTPIKPELLQENEKLYVKFDFRSVKDGYSLNGSPFENPNDKKPIKGALVHRAAKKPFLDLNNVKTNGQTVNDSPQFFDGIEVPAEGVVVEVPITAPGASRCVLFPRVVSSDPSPKQPSQKSPTENRAGLPIFFSFGAIKPNAPLDDRFGVCTHYIWNWWSVDSMPFIDRAGIGMLRDEIYWSSVEKNKGEYVFPPEAKEYIGEAVNRKIDPLIVLTYANRLYDNGDYPISPEARAGYAEYAKQIIKHYKGRVKYVEVWNEWTGGCGMDHVKSKEKQNTPENYVNLLKTASEAIRAENPDACIIGGGGDVPGYHVKAIEAELKAGAMKYCDAYSVHPYRQPGKPDKITVTEVLHIADLMKQNGCKEPKIWITEVGWPTPKAHPAPDTELFQAAILVRSAIPLLATGVVERYFWYSLKNDGLDRVDQEANFGLLRNDKLGLHAKPAYIAYSVMTRHTAEHKIAADKRIGNEKNNLFVFRLQKEGEPDRLVLWTSEGSQSVKLTESVASAYNLFGTPLEIPADNRWTISEEPIWISL